MIGVRFLCPCLCWWPPTDVGVLHQHRIPLKKLKQHTMETVAKRTTLMISSPAFEHEGLIPAQYTCEGAGINPPLSIGGIPDDAKTLALIMEDPDAPGRVFDHWLVWNIPPTEAIPENSVPGLEGTNSRGLIGYTGPCPPSGTHRYFFKVFAVDTLLELAKGADKTKLNYVLQRHVIGYGELIGLYRKNSPRSTVHSPRTGE